VKNLTVRSSLLAALGLFFLMLVIGAASGIVALTRANQSTALVHQVAVRVIGINDAYKDTTRTRSALVRAHAALVKDDKETRNSALKSAQTSYDRTMKQLADFRAAPAFEGQDAELNAALGEAGLRLSASLERAMTALRNDDADGYSTINIKVLTPEGAAFSTQLEKFQKLASSLADDLVAQRQQEYRLVVWLVVGGLGLAGAGMLAVHFLLKRTVTTPLNDAVDMLDRVARGDLTVTIAPQGSNEIGRLFTAIHGMQKGLKQTVAQVRAGADAITGGAQEIASGNMDLSSRTETQASALEQTAASMEELTSTVRQNADNALLANQLADTASANALQGGEVMGQVVDTMNAISASSRKIVDIISVIDGIAFQTNILALNAAVEAARAGEQGRGFAVVASEVRNLAQRSAAAAKEIKLLIDDSVDNVSSGSRQVEQAGATMGEVVASVRRVTDIVREIAAASREQSDGIAQINQAIVQMDSGTQQNAALVEEAAAAALALQFQAHALAETVSIFKLDMAPAVRVTRPPLVKTLRALAAA
jgi:methyl-accepting chemotaxis protein